MIPRPSLRSLLRWPVALGIGALVLGGTSVPRSQAQPADSTAAVDSALTEPASAAPVATRALTPDPVLGEKLRAEGLENLTTLRSDGDSASVPTVGFENRRYRHSATALGTVSKVVGGPFLAYERRLGMIAAAVQDEGSGAVPTRVWYPSDGAFPKAPTGPLLAPTPRTVDLLIGPLFTYELARLFSPALIRVELQPELRYNPWPGGRARAAIVIPIRNDFEVDSLRPDVNKVRPGPVMFEQFAWSPGAALVSACGGLLGNNRYGMSFGVARPLRGGEILLDTQADVSGFFAVSDSGINYSTPSRWTGFVGISYRPPGLDLNVRLRAARYIQNDQGYELEMRRAMGDVDIALSVSRVWISSDTEPTFALTTGGVKLSLPIPPLNRPVNRPVRVLPVDRITFQYREESLPVGVTLSNVASREDFLRHLDAPTLGSNDPRYQAAKAGRPYRHVEERIHWVSLTGMTGFVNTPWAGVMGDQEAEFGYNKIPEEAAYQFRGVHPNEVYYAALGFLPRTEVGLRWTVVPGARPFIDDVPESKTVEADRMFSARFEVLEARPLRPGLAIGVEDLRGTRKYHSTYVVGGMPFEISRLQNRVTVGYAPRVFDRASRRTLDGLFGAFEVTSWRTVAATVEYDTEKVNAMLGINLGFGLRARMAMLDLEHLAVGAGWFKAL